MADDLELVARAEAFRRGRAVPLATHRRVEVQPDALVGCPRVLAGDDLQLHALGLGALDGTLEVRSVADPRRWRDREPLFRWLHERLETYLIQCAACGSFPQLLVASDAAVSFLDLVSESIRTARDPWLVRLGRLLAYATERAPLAGQQALLAATAVLREHWATGQSPEEDHHLLVLLRWIEPLDGVSIDQAVEVAAQVPMGIKTDPGFDRRVLEPQLKRWKDARQVGDELRTARETHAVHGALSPLVTAVFEHACHAFGLVARLPPLPSLAGQLVEEARAFERWSIREATGLPMPVRDSAKAGAFKLVGREFALAQKEADHDDLVVRVRGLMRGELLSGRVDLLRRRKEGRATVITFTVVSAQTVLRMRARDTLCWLADPRLRVVVEGVHQSQGEVQVRVRVVAGMRCTVVPVEGQSILLGPERPDPAALGRHLMQMRDRLAGPAWTHRPGASPVVTTVEASESLDPLARVESLR